MIFKSTGELCAFRSTVRGVVVATNGCFDILHIGHIRCLEAAKALGDKLVVGLNSDQSVSKLKGPGRPFNNQSDRAEALAALRCVDHVCIFEGIRCADFLIAVFPRIYVKGGDYTEETLDPSERDALSGGCDVEIVFIPTVPGHSTTSIMNRIASSACYEKETL